jgi:hypothetical protein
MFDQKMHRPPDVEIACSTGLSLPSLDKRFVEWLCLGLMLEVMFPCDISAWTANMCRDFLRLVPVHAPVSSILSEVNI